MIFVDHLCHVTGIVKIGSIIEIEIKISKLCCLRLSCDPDIHVCFDFVQSKCMQNESGETSQYLFVLLFKKKDELERCVFKIHVLT